MVFHRSAQWMDIDGDVSFCAALWQILFTRYLEHLLSMSILGPERFSSNSLLDYSFYMETFQAPLYHHPPPPTNHCSSLAFLRMVLTTTVGAVLIDHSKLALVGIAYNTILKSWYPAYLRFNVYWNASMRCQCRDGRLRMVRWFGIWGPRVGGMMFEGCWRWWNDTRSD